MISFKVLYYFHGQTITYPIPRSTPPYHCPGEIKKMHNHYHLLLETPDENLCQGIRQLNGTYTQHINKKYQRVGHLFQGRFKSILVEKENYLLALSRYIALNPIRANLVEDPRDWHYSSDPQVIGIVKKIPGLFPDWILSQFGPDKKSARISHQNFIL